jgi:hypothetical protein
MAHQLLERSKKEKEGNCSKDKPDNVMNRNGVGVKNCEKQHWTSGQKENVACYAETI